MKKNLSFLLAMLILAVCFITGCNSTSDEPKSTGSDESAQETATLKYLSTNIAFDPNKEPVREDLEEFTGYKMEYFMLPADNASEKMNIDLASGTSYDIISMSPQNFSNLAAQKALTPLNDLIDEYAPNISTALKEELFAATTIDGVIYGLPGQSANPTTPYWGIVFRQDILDKLNLEVPKDLESFTNCLREIKANENIIPLTTNQPILDHITSAFGLSTYTKEVNGKIVLRPQQEGMKEYLEFMHMLYKEGLLDPDIAINKAENVREKFVSGQAAAMLMTYGSQTPPAILMPALRENLPDTTLTFIEPLPDKNGLKQVPLIVGISNIVVIPKTSEHPEDAMKWINTILDEEISDILAIGEEGIHYEKTNGEYNPIIPKFFEERGGSWWLVPITNHYRFPTYWAEIRIKKNMDIYEVFHQLSKSKDYGVADPIAFMPQTKTRADYEQKLKTIEKDYYMQVIYGASDLSDYDKFVEQWLNSGGQALTDDINAWYQSLK